MSTVADIRDSSFSSPPWRDALPRLAGHRLAVPLVLAPLCAFLFFHGLGAGGLYRTEALRALVAQEFLDSGNWLVPTLHGEPLLTKPPGMYAAIALVSAPFGGVTVESARLPSALAATATVLLVYATFRRYVGRLGGLVAAGVVPTSVMWLDKATAAEIDMLQVFWVAASLLSLLRAVDAEDDDPRRALRWWVAALLAVVGGTLTKWTAPAFFYLTAVPLLWHRKRLRLLFGRNHLVAASLGAVGVGLWVVLAVWQVGGDVFVDTVSREALQRLVPREVPVAPPRHHHRPYPWHETLAHPFVVFGACLPWAPFALLALLPGFGRLWDARGRRLVALLHCWLWPNLLFWTVVPEHATRHSFPLFPAVGGFAALVWFALLTGRMRWPLRRVRAAIVFVGLVVAWLGVKVAFVAAVVPARGQGPEPFDQGAQLAAAVPSGEILYLHGVKDEGLLFHCRRTTRRLPTDLEEGKSVYCLFPETDPPRVRRHAEPLLRLPQKRGQAPFLLVLFQENRPE